MNRYINLLWGDQFIGASIRHDGAHSFGEVVAKCAKSLKLKGGYRTVWLNEAEAQAAASHRTHVFEVVVTNRKYGKDTYQPNVSRVPTEVPRLYIGIVDINMEAVEAAYREEQLQYICWGLE